MKMIWYIICCIWSYQEKSATISGSFCTDGSNERTNCSCFYCTNYYSSVLRFMNLRFSNKATVQITSFFYYYLSNPHTHRIILLRHYSELSFELGGPRICLLRLSVRPSVRLSVHLSVRPSVCPSVWSFENKIWRWCRVREADVRGVREAVPKN